MCLLAIKFYVHTPTVTMFKILAVLLCAVAVVSAEPSRFWYHDYCKYDKIPILSVSRHLKWVPPLYYLRYKACDDSPTHCRQCVAADDPLMDTNDVEWNDMSLNIGIAILILGLCAVALGLTCIAYMVTVTMFWAITTKDKGD
jgi:hypothetical protein